MPGSETATHIIEPVVGTTNSSSDQPTMANDQNINTLFSDLAASGSQPKIQNKIHELCGDDKPCAETLICKPDQNNRTLFDHAIISGSLDTLYTLQQTIESKNCDPSKYRYSATIAEVNFYQQIKKAHDETTTKLHKIEKKRARYAEAVEQHELKIAKLASKKEAILGNTETPLSTLEIEKIRLSEIARLRTIRIEELQRQLKRLREDLKKFPSGTVFSGINRWKKNNIKRQIEKIESDLHNTHETTILEKYKEEINRKIAETQKKILVSEAKKIEREIIQEREEAAQARMAERNARTDQEKTLEILRELEVTKKNKEEALQKEMSLLAVLASAPNKAVETLKKAIDSTCQEDGDCKTKYVCKQQPNKGTLLHAAAESGSLDMMLYIWDLGAKDCKDTKDINNRTAFDVAASPRIKLFLENTKSMPVLQHAQGIYPHPTQQKQTPALSKQKTESLAKNFTARKEDEMKPTAKSSPDQAPISDQELMEIVDQSDLERLEPSLQKIQKKTWDGKISVKQGPNTYTVNLLEYLIWNSTATKPEKIAEALLETGLRINDTNTLFFNDLFILAHLPALSVRFNNIRLFKKLEAVHPDIHHFREVLCETLDGFLGHDLLKNKSLVEGILLTLAREAKYAQVECKLAESPLSISVNSGSDFILPIIQALFKIHCFSTSYNACTKALACSQDSRGQNLLHKSITTRTRTESTTVLEYIWNMGGKDCFDAKSLPILGKNSLGKETLSGRTTPLELAKYTRNIQHEIFLRMKQPSYLLADLDQALPEIFINFSKFALKPAYNNDFRIQLNNTFAFLGAPAMGLFLLYFLIYELFFKKEEPRVNSVNKDYLQIFTDDISPEKLGPTGHFSRLNSERLKKLHQGSSLREFIGSVDNVKPPNPNLKNECEYTPIPITLKKPRHVLFQDHYTVRGTNPNKVLFYIPGTAFYMENKAIDTCITTHLSLALDTTVVCTNHALGPTTPWPNNIDDICRTIEQYQTLHQPTEIRIAGYSAGGLLAILAALIMKKHGLKFDEIILFFPLLDLTGEFRELNPKIIPYLPETLQEKEAQLRIMRESSKEDQIFDGGKRHGKPFECAIAYGFSEEDRTPLTKLRNYSPAWFKPETFTEEGSPPIKIITGKQDYFYLEADILHKKLHRRASVTKIVLDADHKTMWDDLHPIYLAGFQGDSSADEIDLGSPGQNVLNCQSEIKAEINVFENSKKLKEFCKNTTLFRSNPIPSDPGSSRDRALKKNE